MNIRSILASSVMLIIFGIFLYWLYSTGEISVTSIILIVLIGIIFIALTNYFYKRLWPSNDD